MSVVAHGEPKGVGRSWILLVLEDFDKPKDDEATVFGSSDCFFELAIDDRGTS